MGRLQAPATLLVLALVTVGGHGACARRRAPSSTPPRDARPAVHSIVWERDESAAVARARAEHKGIMVSFHATWCVPCVELEELLNEDRIYETVTERFVPLQLDVSADSPESQEKKQRFGVSGSLPALLFFAVDDRGRQLLVAIREDTPNYLESDGLLRAISPAIELLRRDPAAN